MRGVVFTGGRELELMNFPDPTPGPDEVVIEMKASGMCGSDLHQYRRPKAGGETGGLAAPVVNDNSSSNGTSVKAGTFMYWAWPPWALLPYTMTGTSWQSCDQPERQWLHTVQPL